jgi:MoxR-like ATPase
MSDNSVTSLDRRAAAFAQTFERLLDHLELSIRGKRDIVRLALVTLFSEGHLLIEDVPGTGKTTLAKAMAQAIGGTWNRIQFTPDLLPSDVTGTTIWDQRTSTPQFHPGPVFSNVLLGDEINRASPKTQSALLEVMEENQVTVDAEAHLVPRPFIVLATQNSIEYGGTYPLPEAQVDRFLMRIGLGYLDKASEVDVLMHHQHRTSQLPAEPPSIGIDHVRSMIEFAGEVHAEESLVSYVVELTRATRTLPEVRLGVSTRGSIALLRASRALAASEGRGYVVPDDVRRLAEPVLAHRLILTSDAEIRGVEANELIDGIVGSMRPPLRR